VDVLGSRIGRSVPKVSSQCLGPIKVRRMPKSKAVACARELLLDRVGVDCQAEDHIVGDHGVGCSGTDRVAALDAESRPVVQGLDARRSPAAQAGRQPLGLSEVRLASRVAVIGCCSAYRMLITCCRTSRSRLASLCRPVVMAW